MNGSSQQEWWLLGDFLLQESAGVQSAWALDTVEGGLSPGFVEVVEPVVLVVAESEVVVDTWTHGLVLVVAVSVGSAWLVFAAFSSLEVEVREVEALDTTVVFLGV